jgi:hypothetical protein
MKKRFLFITLVFAGCATPLPQTPPAGVAARIEAPPVSAGERWTYRAHDGYTRIERGTYRETLVDVGPQALTVQVSRDGTPDQTLRYTRDWNWLDKPMTNLQNFRYDPPYPALPFPLHAGKSWRTGVSATDPVTGRVNRVLIHGEVLGWERVRVPAGEFDTLKIRRVVYAGNAQFFRGEEEIVEYDWYAPALGHVVKRSESSEYRDTSRGCDKALIVGCRLKVKNDWTVLELAAHEPGGGPKPGIQ